MAEEVNRVTGAAIGVFLAVLAAGGTILGAESRRETTGPAEIELRKSFQVSPRADRSEVESETDVAATGGAVRDDERGVLRRQIGAVAEALGERLQTSGTIHFPDVGARATVLQGETTPILSIATGRHLIIDADRTIDPEIVARITRRWPDFLFVQPPSGASLRDITGSLLDAAGYDSVVRAAPLVFGSGITVKFIPDFVVLRSDLDLLSGETRAISFVDPAEALPAELRELAGSLRVRIVEMTLEGAPAGVYPAPWRDPIGRVTTMESSRLTQVMAEIAVAVGIAVERHVPLPASEGRPVVTADLRLSRAGDAAFVVDRAFSRAWARPPGGDQTTIVLESSADLPRAIGVLLGNFDIAAIGPVVELSRAPRPGATRRFFINVPGWLASLPGGRKLLITGAALPPLVRLYLTREGIDLFEYRVRDES